MSRQDHLLIVDDDPEIRHLLADYLSDAGYQVSTASDGREMRRRLEMSVIDLVVLDLMLPGEDGLALCRELRASSNIPVVMLTARGSLVDRIVGLEMGADDYLPKPFDPRELLVRIKVVLRRAQSFPERAKVDELRSIRFDGWTLEIPGRQVVSPQGVVIALGNSDFRLLRLMLQYPNRPLSRDYLLNHVFDKDSTPFNRSIDVCVSRLRQQLAPELIRTVRNQGYLLAVEQVEGQR
ncbi:response regulator [Pseudomonas sp. DTU_2021_1001937_2_SI_NGA_ILE_001]|uniref:response regulator n=1 Tax=Pseudomonas sp. DTU_2021_1001937_2_SI_NGA_ILE_001 TaxID=3077589 RepID=UPI0028FC0EBA|nr:response regulator [Pseudomonas sp. DTU_2021_1001937_2_SI_NGA_ILE_001]WNW12168.1 response regulator [Pseudomonas sp. DTU_2021_1001937_2_SI_NGA_ILE_001]